MTLHRLLRGQSAHRLSEFLLLLAALGLALDLLVTPQSLSWAILKGFGAIVLGLSAVASLSSRAGDAMARFEEAYDEHVTLVVSLGLLAWGGYLLATGSDELLFLAVSLGGGVVGVGGLLWHRLRDGDSAQPT